MPSPSRSQPTSDIEDADDDIWMTSDTEDTPHGSSTSERRIAEQEWQKLHTNFGNDGYREGLAEGKESVLQDSFDTGYGEGVPVGHLLGRLLGTVESLIAANTTSRGAVISDPAHLAELQAIAKEARALDVRALFGPKYQPILDGTHSLESSNLSTTSDARIKALAERANHVIQSIGLDLVLE